MADTSAAPDTTTVDDGLVGVTIDGREVRVAKDTLVLDAALEAGVHIPVYCAHPKMDPVAVCRMCLVAIEKMPKLQPACATVVSDGMVVTTQSDQVAKAREGVLEFLLLNHPLDCPVCDRGGECDLQDFAFRYGPQNSRFRITDKAHKLKALPISDKIELDQERCVLCWRCVRYYDEVTGEKELVLGKRGVKTVIETFDGGQLTSDFQGNLPEICPVGALTHRQYRFQARPWDLQRASSVCPGCSYGCNISVDRRDFEIKRFVSRDNPLVDDSWLCDRGRYSSIDWNARDRVRRPALRPRNGHVSFPSVEQAVEAAADELTGIRDAHGGGALAVIASTMLTNEELALVERLGRAVLQTPHLNHTMADLADLAPDEHALGIAEIEECTTAVVLGDAPEKNDPVLTLRLFKAETKKGVRVLRVRDGDEVHLTDADTAVGLIAAEEDRRSAASLASSLAAPGRTVRRMTVTTSVNARGAKDLGLLPQLEAGYVRAALQGKPLADVLDLASDKKIRGLLIVHGADLVAEIGKERFEKALGACECVVALEDAPSVVSEHATVLLPGHSYFEKQGTVTNTEGRVQEIRPALPPATKAPAELVLLADLARECGVEIVASATPEGVRAELRERVPAYAALPRGGRLAWS